VSLMRTTHRIVMLDAGRIIAEGTPDAIRASDHPQVQAFLQMASAERL